MDPLTQGVVGALAAQSVASRKNRGLASLAGAAGGLAADLDIFISSAQDPLLALEFHRHFTHSLVFVPFGALIIALIFYGVLGRWQGRGFKACYLWSFCGYATHGLLDSCTSYGTQLLWPFSDTRVSWDLISVIDPLFTLPLLLGALLAGFRRSHLWLALALLWGGVYMAFAWYQRDRALTTGYDIAAARGHTPVRLQAKPGFANLIVWKLVYETDTHFFVDAVRPDLGGGTRVWNGESIPKFDPNQALPWLAPDSQQARDIERFRWFSDGFIALDKHHEDRVIDIRYSLVPDTIQPLWWIELDREAGARAHVDFEQSREGADAAARRLWQMVLGRD